MRKNHKLVRAIAGVTPVIALAALSGTASATTYIYDPFDYTAGQDLLGKTDTYVSPNHNWLLAATSAPDKIKTATVSLTGVPPELKPPIGNELTVQGIGTNSGATDRFSLFNDTTSLVSSGTVYYSFLLRVDALTGSNNTIGGYFFSLNNTGNSSQATNPTISPARMQMRIDPGDASKFSLEVLNNRAAVSSDLQWYNGLTLGQTYFVVAATDVTSSTVAANARMWINPSSTTYGAGTAPAADRTDTVAGASISSGIKSILVRQSPAPYLTLDEVRVASSWSEVTVTPAAYWDIDGATAGAGGATPSGTWDGATSNWSGSSAGDATAITWPGAGNKAVFSAGTNATGAYTITVSGTQSATALSFEDGTPTLTGGTVNLTQASLLDASTGVTATIASTITGSNGISKSGSGTVALTGTMSYTGATTIIAGTLQVGNGGTTEALPTSSAITTNGTLAFNRSNDVTQGTDFSGSAITGTGGITQAGTANLILNVANTFSGTTKATSGTLTAAHSLALQNSIVDTSGAGSIAFDNALTSASVGGLSGSTNYSANSALALTVGNSTGTVGRDATFGGVISGTGSVTKILVNTQELSGVNTYSGGTNISAGVLQFGATASMPASGAVAVNSGGTLAVHVSGAGEWATTGTGAGTITGLIAGDGGQTASQVTWNDGSSLGINTQPVGTTLNTADVTYAGNIGSFNGVSDLTKSVGFTKSGYGTLTLTGSNTFRGQLKVANEGGTLRVTTALPNAGQSMAIPTVSIGNALVTNPTILKLLVDNALPSNSLINFGSGVAGNVTAKTVLRLHDADPVASYPAPAIPAASYNQTIRGITGGSGLVQVGAGTLTIDVPTGESYSWSGTLRTDADTTWHSTSTSGARGVVIKTGLGRQDITQFNSEMSGEFILQQGTLGVSDQQAFGGAINTATPPFYDSTSAKLTINGGTLMNISGGSQTFSVANISIGGSFTFDPVGASNSQFLNKSILLTTANPTITVLPGTGGQFIFASDINESAPGYGFTKAGTGILNLTSDNATMNTFTGAVTVLAGQLRTVAPVRIGAGTGDLNLSGGQLAFNGGLNGLAPHTSERYEEISNPLHVTADSSIAYDSTTGNLTDVTDPLGIQYVFTSNTVDRTGGTLTFSYLNTASTTTVTYRPRFTGSGFDYSGPVVINKGTGARNTVLESMNTSGTQTWSGDMTGTGSYSRGAGGTSVLGGQTISVNIANASSIIFDRATAQTFSAVMSGTGTATKQGAGTLTFSGANTYSGVTTINAGTLQVGSGGTTGTLGSGNVTDDGNLAFSRSNAMTVANVISGTGTVTQGGSGTTTLSGANTYTGNTNINAGTLSVGNSGNLGGSSNGIVFNGGTLAATGAVASGGRNVTVNAGNGTIDTAANSVTVGNVDGIGNFTKSGAGGNLTVNRLRVNNANVTDGIATAAAVADPTSSASVTPGVSVVNSLVVSGTGTVNLTNNRIITNDVQGVEAGGIYDGVQGLVQSGKIFTQEALFLANQTAIGVATAAESKGLVGAATTLWSGQTIDSNDTLVMYTWAGDANLDGKVNADDYASIDLYSTVPGADSWNHGDFNYNGVINADDYALIDNNVQNPNYVPYWTTDALRNLEGGGAATAGLTAVPEPTSIGLLMVSAAGLLGRRRRRCGPCR